MDIAAMQVDSDKAVSQLHYAEGGAHGGILVNKNFISLLEEVFGVKEMIDFKVKVSPEFENLLQVSVNDYSK